MAERPASMDWEDYSLAELGNWVHLLVKRAKFRQQKWQVAGDKEKIHKDLCDAQNYLNTMQDKLDEAKTWNGIYDGK